MRTSHFMEDPQGWDTSLIGIIYVTEDRIRQESGVKRVSPAIRRKVEQILASEVEDYSLYLSGDIYGYVVEAPDGTIIDSCWGYFGDEIIDGINEAKAVIDRKIESNRAVA